MPIGHRTSPEDRTNSQHGQGLAERPWLSDAWALPALRNFDRH